MKVWVIGHPEAVEGFALVGVHGIVAETHEAVNLALDKVLAMPDVGILMITDDACSLVSGRILDLKRKASTPLVVEIPGPHSDEIHRFGKLSDVVNQAIGIQK